MTPLGNRSADAYGSFPLEIRLARDQELGYYTVHAQAPNGEELYGYFRVAQFKPPNFSVALTLGSQYGVEGSNVRASAISKYLFGAPVSGGERADQRDAPADVLHAGRLGRLGLWPLVVLSRRGTVGSVRRSPEDGDPRPERRLRARRPGRHRSPVPDGVRSRLSDDRRRQRRRLRQQDVHRASVRRADLAQRRICRSRRDRLFA